VNITHNISSNKGSVKTLGFKFYWLAIKFNFSAFRSFKILKKEKSQNYLFGKNQTLKLKVKKWFIFYRLRDYAYIL
jgi:hypothetical protein